MPTPMISALASVVLLGLITTATVSTVVTNLAFLSGKRGVRASSALLVGWELALLVVFVVGLGLSTGLSEILDRASQSGNPVVAWGEVVIGLVMIGVGIWGVTRGRGQVKRATDKAFARVDDTSLRVALWLGIFYGVLNWIWTFSAAAQVVRADVWPLVGPLILLGTYLGVAALSVIVPLGLVIARPKRAGGTLQAMREWISAHGDIVIAGISGVVGVVFVLKGLAAALG